MPLRDLLSKARPYAPYGVYGLTAGTVAGAPGSEYYGPILGAVGNLFDLPGSSVRDLLAGENPFDQWASPLSGDNRATGRDVLERFGMRANRETGMAGWLDDPMEGLRDLAGFGVELATDPLNFASMFKLGKLFRTGKSAAAHNAALDALQRNPERQRLGQQMSEAFGESGDHTMALIDAATIRQGRDPGLVYGSLTVKNLERAATGVAAATAAAEMMMPDSPGPNPLTLNQPSLPDLSRPLFPRLMEDEAIDLFSGNITHDQYNALIDTPGYDSSIPRTPRLKTPKYVDFIENLWSKRRYDREELPNENYRSAHKEVEKEVEAMGLVPGSAQAAHAYHEKMQPKIEALGRLGKNPTDDVTSFVGTNVGSRIDIKEFARGNPIGTLHFKDGPVQYVRAVQLLPQRGKALVEFGLASNNKTQIANPLVEHKIAEKNVSLVASGEGSKNSWAVMSGQVGPTATREQVREAVMQAMQDPQWQQVGFNPERHSYFYLQGDHRTRVTGADEVLQYGDLVLAKNPRTEMMGSEGIRQRLQAVGLIPDDVSPRALYQQAAVDGDPRAQIQFTPEGAVITPFAPDASTAPHEVGHYLDRLLRPRSQRTRNAEEAFAGGLENYLATTQTSSPGMANAMGYFNREIPRVYDPQYGFRNLPARGGEDYGDLFGITDTTSPLDRQQVPDLATPAGQMLLRNILARFNPYGGVQ